MEHKVILQDSLMQILTEPEELTILNLDESRQPTSKNKLDDNIIMHCFFDLSKKIQVEKRIVTSLPQLFGDLGGLYGALATISLLLISRYQRGTFSLHHIESQYRLPPKSREFNKLFNALRGVNFQNNLTLRPRVFKEINLGLLEKLGYIYWPCCRCLATHKAREKNKIIFYGRDQIQKQLDTKRLIRMQRAFSQLLYHSYSEASRKLLHLQRRSTVLKSPADIPRLSSSDSDKEKDEKKVLIQLKT